MPAAHALTSPVLRLANLAQRTSQPSLLLKLTILVGSTVGLLVAALLFAGSLFWRDILRDEIHARLSAVAESRSDFVREWISRQQDRADVFASRGVLRSWLERLVDQRSEDVQRLLSQGNLDRYVQSGAALVAAIADTNGRVLLSTEPADVGRNLSKHPTFIEGLRNPVVGLPQRDRDRLTVLTAVPVQRLQGAQETVGVVLLTLDATPLANALRATTGLGTTGDVVVAVRDGTQALYLLAPRYLDQEITAPLVNVPAMEAAVGGREFLGLTTDYRGERVLAAGRPVGYGGWGLVAKMDAKEAYAPIASAVRHAILLALVVGVAGLVAAFLLSRGITRPIRTLVEASERVAARDYTTTVPVIRQDELGVLALRFNQMISALHAHKAERDAREAAVREAESALREANEQLEARVADRTARLQETVAELERFSYSLSHDMRAPLRAMEGYASALLEDYGDKLGPEARNYLERIIAAAIRQDRLIIDVLSYSRVVRTPIALTAVDLDGLVGDLFHQYPDLRDRAALISVQSPLGVVRGHDVLLTQCLTNLLSNALKFVPRGKEPRVVVRTEPRGGSVWLWVEDNGIGIAAEHHERIFGILERVHPQRDYEGTGIGLAIVRKAVERMNGEVGVISAPGVGSRFWVKLWAAEHASDAQANPVSAAAGTNPK